jgi:hypothetical protein
MAYEKGDINFNVNNVAQEVIIRSEDQLIWIFIGMTLKFNVYVEIRRRVCSRLLVQAVGHQEVTRLLRVLLCMTEKTKPFKGLSKPQFKKDREALFCIRDRLVREIRAGIQQANARLKKTKLSFKRRDRELQKLRPSKTKPASKSNHKASRKPRAVYTPSASHSSSPANTHTTPTASPVPQIPSEFEFPSSSNRLLHVAPETISSNPIPPIQSEFELPASSNPNVVPEETQHTNRLELPDVSNFRIVSSELPELSSTHVVSPLTFNRVLLGGVEYLSYLDVESNKFHLYLNNNNNKNLTTAAEGDFQQHSPAAADIEPSESTISGMSPFSFQTPFSFQPPLSTQSTIDCNLDTPGLFSKVLKYKTPTANAIRKSREELYTYQIIPFEEECVIQHENEPMDESDDYLAKYLIDDKR